MIYIFLTPSRVTCSCTLKSQNLRDSTFFRADRTNQNLRRDTETRRRFSRRFFIVRPKWRTIKKFDEKRVHSEGMHATAGRSPVSPEGSLNTLIIQY